MQQQSKQELAYATVRRRILDGTYVPGYRLVLEDLARELGTSAIPIREAVRRLEAEGLVTYQHNSGARVAGPDPRAVVEILSVLAELESYATELAAPHLTADDLAALRDANTQLAAALASGDPVRFSQLNRAFHATIYRKCPNTYAVETIQRAWEAMDRVRRSVFLYARGRAQESLAEHEELVRLLAAGAAPGALREFVRRHKQRTVRAFEAWEAEQRRQAAPALQS